MTPKIQKKINALQAKMQKKHPDYEINYVYDKKGKVYALSYNENTQQFVSLKNMKPVSQDTELFDVNDQPFGFNSGPDLYEVFDKDGNQTVLAFDKESAQFFNPETGEPVNIENYNDAEGNPIDPSQFIVDEQTNNSEVNNSDNDQANQDLEQENLDDQQPANEQNNDFVEDKYEESVPTTEFQGLEYASPTVGVQQPNNLTPENFQNLNQPDNQQNNNFYPNDNYQNQDNTYQDQQLVNQNYDQANNYQDPYNNLNQQNYPQDLVTPEQNNYGYVDQQNNNLNQPNYPQDLAIEQNNNFVDPNLNNSQIQNNNVNLNLDNFNQKNNQFENYTQQPQQSTLSYKTIDSSTIPTTEVASSVNNFAATQTPIISVPKSAVNNEYVQQPAYSNNETNISANLKDNLVTPILETVIDSNVDVKLDPVIEDSNKPKDQFMVFEEPKNDAEKSKEFVVSEKIEPIKPKDQFMVFEEFKKEEPKEFIISEEAASNNLFNKKTAEIFIDETFNHSVFKKPNQNQDFVISKPVIEPENSLSYSKVFITPEVRPQPQAVYSSAAKKEFEPNNSYSTRVNLKDFNSEHNVAKPNVKPNLNSNYFEEAPKPYHKTPDYNEYKSADLHDFEINKNRFDEPKHVQSFSNIPEYEPPVQNYEYNPDEQNDLYDEKPYSSFRNYRDYEAPKYYQNDNYLENSNYSYYKSNNRSLRPFNYQPLSTFRPSSSSSYLPLKALDSNLLLSSRPSSYYPASRSLTVLIDNDYDSSFRDSHFRNYRSSYGSSRNYYRSSPTYGYNSRRTLSDYAPYQVRSFKNWQPSSLTSSINIYSMPLPSSYRGYSSQLRNYRNW